MNKLNIAVVVVAIIVLACSHVNSDCVKASELSTACEGAVGSDTCAGTTTDANNAPDNSTAGAAGSTAGAAGSTAGAAGPEATTEPAEEPATVSERRRRAVAANCTSLVETDCCKTDGCAYVECSGSEQLMVTSLVLSLSLAITTILRV